MKFNKRYSIDSLSRGTDEDQHGLMFVNSQGMTDLTGVIVLGASIDTVRQIFSGVPRLDMIERLNGYLEEKENIITLEGRGVWHFSRMSKKSGYRYKLQNNEFGLIILFCSWYGMIDNEGSHLKFELSPHFILTRTPKQIKDYLGSKIGGLAGLFLDDYKAHGVAIHQACDYQGFDLPDDFITRFATSSRTVRNFDGISTLDLSGFSDAVATYGGKSQERNYTIGKPQSVQMCLYGKTQEVIKSDKVDYFYEQWQIYSLGAYDDTKDVRRIEARVHHTIIREIGLGMGLEFEEFSQVVPYLTDIWRYALQRNRLMVSAKNLSQGYVEPFWQLLMEDVEFYCPAKAVKIVRKKKEAVDPISKNITSVLGNYLSIVARQGLSVERVMAQLRALHIYDDIVAYYRRRGLSEVDLKNFVKEGLQRRRIYGKAA
jgi:hypothetical protein